MEPLEEYHSPFDFEQGVNSSYLYLSPEVSDTPPSSPAGASRGAQQYQDSAAEVGEDAATSVSSSFVPPALTEEERLELQEELVKVEDEIQTLSQVLAAKEGQLADIKRKLGVTPLNELKQNISRTWQEVTTSNAYRRTSETLSQAGQKATAAFSNVGSAITKRFEDVRNAQTFKTLEEKMGTLKTKMSPSGSSGAAPVDQDGDAVDADGPASEALLSQPEAPPPSQEMLMN